MTISKEFKVGVFAIVATATLYIGFNYLKGVDFLTSTQKYYVLYDDIGGLSVSAGVKISGFNVGRVSDIRLLQGLKSKVLVELDIESDITLGDSAVAKLDSDLLGGGGSIIILVGNIKKPIKSGDTLIARVDPGLAEIFQQSTAPITNNLPLTIAKLNKLMDEFQGVGDTLKIALVSFTKTSDNLNLTLSTNKPKIDSTISEMKIMIVGIKNRMNELKPVISKYSLLADSLNNVDVSKTLQKLNVFLDEATSTLKSVSDEKGTIGKLMKDDSLYQNLNNTLLDLDSLLLHMNNYPKHFFAPLGKKRKKIEKDLQKQANN